MFFLSRLVLSNPILSAINADNLVSIKNGRFIVKFTKFISLSFGVMSGLLYLFERDS